MLIIRNNIKGFSLIEIVLSIAIFVMLISSFTGSLIYGLQLSFNSGSNMQASYIAEEGLEVMRNIRDDNFAYLQDGTYGVDTTGNQVEIYLGTNTFGKFKRSINISHIDMNTTKIESVVSWDEGIKGSGEVSMQSILTNWRKPIGKGGMIVYTDNSVSKNEIKYRILYPDNTWGPQLTILDYGNPYNSDVRRLELYSSPDRDEKILVVKNGEDTGSNQYFYATVWNGTKWANNVVLTGYDNNINPHTRNFDGTYLSNGDFLLIYDDFTYTPKYRIWNGSSWTEERATRDIGGYPVWMVLKNKKGTNEAIAIIRDAVLTYHVNTMYFNGTSWSSVTDHSVYSPGFSIENIAYEWSSNTPASGLLMYNESYDNYPNIKKWNGSWGSSIENISVGATALQTRLINRPSTDSFLGCVKDNSADINCLVTNLTPSWSSTVNGEIATNTDGGDQISFDLVYEPSGENALVVYSNGSSDNDKRIVKYRTFDPSNNTWSAERQGTTLGIDGSSSLETVILIPKPNSNIVMTLLGTSDQDLWAVGWDCDNNTFFNSGSLQATELGTHGSYDEDFWFDFAWDIH